MQKNNLCVSIMILAASCLGAQDFCDNILKQARDSLRAEAYAAAIKKLQDAEVCDYQNTLFKKRIDLQDSIFAAIQQQRENAEKAARAEFAARKEAERQTRVAKAGALAARAQELLPKDPTLALNLAAAAYATEPTVQAAEAFAIVLNNPRNIFYAARRHVSIQEYIDPIDELEPLFAVSPDGEIVVAVRESRPPKVLAAATGELLFELDEDFELEDIFFTPDANFLITYDLETCKVWDLRPGKRGDRLHTRGKVQAIGFSAVGSTLVLIDDNYQMHLWKESWAEERTISGLQKEMGRLKSAALSGDGKRVLTNHNYGDSLLVWELSDDDSLRRLQSFHLEVDIRSVALAPGGDKIAVVDEQNVVQLLFVGSRGKPLQLPRALPEMTAEEEGFLTIGSERAPSEYWPEVAGVYFSPGGDRVVTLGRKLVFNSVVKIWDSNNGRELYTLKGLAGPIQSIGFTSGGSQFVTICGIVTAVNEDTAYLEPEIMTWEAQPWSEPVEEGQITVDRPAVAEGFTASAAAADGAWIARGTEKGQILIRNIRTGKELSRKAHESEIRTIVFTPDGRRVFTGSDDGSARLWDLPSGKESRHWLPRENSYDFEDIFTMFRNPQSGKEDLGGVAAEVTSAAFSPDSDRLLIVTDDDNAYKGVYKVWDLQNKVLLFSLEGKRNRWFADYSPDGSRISITDRNGNYQTWADPIGSLRAGRYYQLNADEQKRYDLGPEYCRWLNEGSDCR